MTLEQRSKLIPFSEKYFGYKNNWHHKLFYLILENLIYQKDEVFYVAGTQGKKITNKNILCLSPRFHSKCLYEDELIQTPEGLVPIKDIKVGQQVYSKEGITYVLAKVYSGEKMVYKLSLCGGGSIVATKDHRVLTWNGFKRIGKLKDDDLVALSFIERKSLWRKVEKIEPVGIRRTYDIQTEHENFLNKDGIVTHNSSVFSFVYPLWEIVKNPNIRILILSANEDIASSFVRQQMMALENNEELLKDFGNLMPRTRRKWGERAFIVRRDTKEKDPTVSAAGFMGRIISKRADIIIMDDIIDLERSRTEKQRQKVSDWFANVVYPILSPEGRLIIVGTRFHKEDFYYEIIKQRSFDITLSLRALVFSSGGTIQKRGNKEKIQFRKTPEMPYNPITDEPLSQDISKIFSKNITQSLRITNAVRHGVLWYPEWSYEKLMEKKKVMGISAFYCQYLNEPVSDTDSYFRKQSIDECYQRGSGYALPDFWDNVNFPHKFPHEQLLVVMGVDLAISSKFSSDYSAIAVWGMNVSGMRYLLYIDKFKADVPEIRQKIIDVYHLYNPVICVVESNAFQDLLRQELAEDINIIGEKTTSYNKFDETLGIAHLSSLFDSGKITIPNLGVKGYAAKSFYNDLISYTADSHTPDTIMASWLALKKIQEFSESIKTQSGYFSQFSVNYQISNLISPHKIILTSNLRALFSAKSTVSVFLPREKSFLKTPEEIIKAISEYPLFVVVKQSKTFLAYFINLETKELIVKIDGGGSLSFFGDTLFNWATMLNSPQIVVYDSEPIGYYLEEKKYSKMFCLFNNKEGKPAFKKTICKSDIMLSVYMDRARYMIEDQKIPIKDSATFREFNKILSIEGDNINTIDNEAPDRAITYSLALSLSEFARIKNKETKKKAKVPKPIYPPYQVFNYDIG